MPNAIQDFIRRDDALSERAKRLNVDHGGARPTPAQTMAWTLDLAKLTNDMRAHLERIQAVVDAQAGDDDMELNDAYADALRRLHDAIEKHPALYAVEDP